MIEKYMIETQFKPDWSLRGNASFIEKELGNFKFNGPGWYTEKSDTILIIPINRSKLFNDNNFWNSEFSEDELFEINVYNNTNTFYTFMQIANAPKR